MSNSSPGHKAAVRAWQKANPAKVKAAYDRYRAKNPDKVAAWDLKKRQLHPLSATYRRQWRAVNLEKAREYASNWNARHPETVNRNQANRRARKMSASVEPFTVAQLKARMTEFHNQCVYCSGPFEHIDHAVPLSRGGAHALFNLVPACARCNQRKGSMTHLEFMAIT